LICNRIKGFIRRGGKLQHTPTYFYIPIEGGKFNPGLFQQPNKITLEFLNLHTLRNNYKIISRTCHIIQHYKVILYCWGASVTDCEQDVRGSIPGNFFSPPHPDQL
jgi:hypothetical protein